MRLVILTILILNTWNISSLQLNRVILSSDANPYYLDFWNLAARIWQEKIGLRPTLILIAHEDVNVDETIGDVIRFTPLPDVPIELQAQAIRLLAPALFPEDVSIIADIDMFPITKEYFTDHAAQFPNDHFIVYNSAAYVEDNFNRYPMCYNAAKGSVWGEIFNVHSVGDFPSKLREWHARNIGWCTDEFILIEYLKKWPDFSKRCDLLGLTPTGRRIDRSYWQYSELGVRDTTYIDAHLPRPYKDHKAEVDHLAKLIGIGQADL